MKRIFLFLLITQVFAAWAQPKLVDGVVAVVGKNIVLKSDVDQQYESMMQQGLGKGEGDVCKVFEELLFEKLMLHQAELDSVSVSEEEVEASIQRRMDMFIQQVGSEQKLEQYYKKSIIEIKEEMRPFMKDQMTAQKMMGTITADIKITPSEVREFFKKIPKDSLPLINSEVEYAVITHFPDAGQEAVDATIKQLNDLKERIENGSSFSTMAVLYSEDPGSAKDGGKYEGIKRGQFVKEFEAVAFNLKMGEISKPFKSEYGYHIVQLLMRRGEELDLRHILIKPKITPTNLEVSKLFLDSVRSQILNKAITFEAAAEKFSHDENSKLNGGIAMNLQTGDSRWETSQLDQAVFYDLEKLEVGRISEAAFFREPDGKEGYRLIMLISKTEPHRADLKQDYQKLQAIALRNKQNEATQKWIEEKLRDTYVRVNNEYLSCSFNSGWIKRSQYVE